MAFLFVLGGVITMGALFFGWINWVVARDHKREQHIRSYVFATHLLDQVRQAYPHLALKDEHLVARALREFFLIHLRTQPLMIGMPSKAVDALWHAFILDSREYHVFCRKAFGQYFHHVPVARMGRDPGADNALRRTWYEACREENINPRRPTRKPLLFAIDEKLNVPDGQRYALQPLPDRADHGADGGGASGSTGGSDAAYIGYDGFACSGAGLIGDSGGGGDGSGGGDGGGDGGGGCGGGCGGGGGD